MTDRYCVFGHPVAHSKSPAIHAVFARQTGQDLSYEAICAPLDAFPAAVAEFRAAGGRGANVTVPFKEGAFRLADRRTPRAERAGAVNTLRFDADGVLGDNTDGCGLLRDLTLNLNYPPTGARVLLLGAGGAARGALGPLLESAPASLVIANRTAGRARDLAGSHAGLAPNGIEPRGGAFSDLTGAHFDLVINATSASLSGALPPLPPGIFAEGALAYDMMYGSGPDAATTPFLRFARDRGARVADGLGMLVEQAAEAFCLWRGLRPDPRPLIGRLRSGDV